MAGSSKTGLRKFKSGPKLAEVMSSHFYELDRAAKERSQKIAWCTSVGPAELLRAMGFLVYFPENHGALLGVTRKASEFIPVANSAGYSPDVCSYMTSDIGAFISGKTPLSAAYPGIDSVPRPDVLVYNTNQCREVKDWFNWYSRKLQVPCIGIDTFRNIDRVTNVHVQAISAQIKSLVPILEKISERPLDMDRFKEVVGLSRQCSDLWEQVLLCATSLPSPLTFFDSTIHMGPAVVARGTRGAIDYYEELLSELNDRKNNAVAAVKDEQHRIYWDGMPIWGKLRSLENLFRKQGASVVASTYCNSWILSSLDADDPFDSMARAYTQLFITRSENEKERYIKQMVEKYEIDGIVFHDSKTCPSNSNCRHGMHTRVSREIPIPHMVIYGDLNDLRMYSEEQSATKIEAFIEQLSVK